MEPLFAFSISPKGERSCRGEGSSKSVFLLGRLCEAPLQLCWLS